MSNTEPKRPLNQSSFDLLLAQLDTTANSKNTIIGVAPAPWLDMGPKNVTTPVDGPTTTDTDSRESLSHAPRQAWSEVGSVEDSDEQAESNWFNELSPRSLHYQEPVLQTPSVIVDLGAGDPIVHPKRRSLRPYAVAMLAAGAGLGLLVAQSDSTSIEENNHEQLTAISAHKTGDKPNIVTAAIPQEVAEVRSDIGLPKPGSKNPEQAMNAGASDTKSSTPHKSPLRIDEGSCSLRVASKPSNAAVLIDGQPAGTTPVDIEGLWCGQSVNVVVAKKNLATWQRKVTTEEGRSSKLLARLKRQSTVLELRSTPPGAEVWLGDKRVGVTPTVIQAEAFVATHVELRKPGFVSARKRIVPQVRKKNSIALTLTKIRVKQPKQ